MKKLKIVLQCSFLYYFVFFLSLVCYFVQSNLDHVSVYNNFSSEEFIITGINIKDYGIKLDLKGKEKIIGYLYYDKSEINSFLNIYELGDLVKISGEVSFISNSSVPDTFNYKKYLKSNEIYNVVVISNISLVHSNKNIFYSLKNKLFDRGMRLSKSYPYVNSLIFGNNNYLDDEVMASYRENGISHLFAISGMHISMFICMISIFLDKLRIKLFIKSVILICFLLFYMFLTNFSMSVMRGAIFAMLLLVNKVFKLEISSINLLLLAFSLILFCNPLNLNNVGLQYSFLVTLFLLLYSKIFDDKGKIYTLFMISFIAFLVSYPITINNFNQINFLSIVYNLFFVPYVSCILLPFTMLSYLFPFFDSILYCLIRINEMLSQYLYHISFLKVSMCKMNVLMVAGYFVIICRLFSCFEKRKFRYLCFTFLFFCLHFFLPFRHDDYILFFDVGQGDSTLINVDNSVTLVDTGGMMSFDNQGYNYNISKNKLLPYLKSNGIRKIDNLILTHGDADHMREAYYIVNNFDVGRIIFNRGEYNDLELELIKLLKLKKIHYYNNLKQISVGDNKLYFLNDSIYDNENDNSIVLYIEIKGNKFLLMGDASVKTESDILKKHNLGNIDVIKVGHHGSNTSSSENFIKEIHPKYSIISVGRNNGYGHPNDEVLDILSMSKIYRTDQDGSVMFEIGDNYLDVKAFPP